MQLAVFKYSGQNRVHRMQTQYVTDGLIQKWHRDITRGKFKRTQMDDLGITGLDVKDLKRNIKKYSKTQDGLFGEKVHKLNLQDWEPEVRHKYALMLHRKSKNAVQDIFAGETPLWMNTSMGKFMSQFRSFTVAALAKQTTRDLKMLKQGDIEGAVALEFMLATSSMAVLAKVGWNSMSKSDKDRKEYLDHALDPKNFLTQVLSYTGSTSAPIDLFSTASTQLFGVNLDGQKYYSADGIAGISPGVQYVNRAMRATQGIIKAPFVGMNKSDARAVQSVLPMNTLWGFDYTTSQVVNAFPDKK